MAAEAHVPLARVRNFRVREGFTSGRELDTYFTNVCLLHAIVRVFYSLCTRGAGLRCPIQETSRRASLS